MAVKTVRRPTPNRIDAFQFGQGGIVRHSPHGLADSGVFEGGEDCRHDDHRQHQILDLLRSHPNAVDAPVAGKRQIIAPELVAETETNHVFKHDRQGDRCDGGRQRAIGAKRLQGHLVRYETHQGRDEKRGDQCRGGGKTQPHVGGIACESTDGGVAGN